MLEVRQGGSNGTFHSSHTRSVYLMNWWNRSFTVPSKGKYRVTGLEQCTSVVFSFFDPLPQGLTRQRCIDVEM